MRSTSISQSANTEAARVLLDSYLDLQTVWSTARVKQQPYLPRVSTRSGRSPTCKDFWCCCREIWSRCDCSASTGDRQCVCTFFPSVRMNPQAPHFELAKCFHQTCCKNRRAVGRNPRDSDFGASASIAKSPCAKLPLATSRPSTVPRYKTTTPRKSTSRSFRLRAQCALACRP